MATFEGYERRIDKINAALAQYGIESLEAADALLKDKGIDVRSIVLGIQPIAFENAVWAYTLGAAIAVKKGNTELLDHINSVIADVTSSGEMDEMVNQANLDSEY